MMLRYNYRFWVFSVQGAQSNENSVTNHPCCALYYVVSVAYPRTWVKIAWEFNSSLSDLEGLYKVEIVKLVWFRPY